MTREKPAHLTADQWQFLVNTENNIHYALAIAQADGVKLIPWTVRSNMYRWMTILEAYCYVLETHDYVMVKMWGNTDSNIFPHTCYQLISWGIARENDKILVDGDGFTKFEIELYRLGYQLGLQYLDYDV